jgi:cell division protein FtsW
MFVRSDTSRLGQWWWTVDRPLLISVLILMIAGVILVAAASPPIATRIHLPPFYFVTRHVVYLVLALVVMMMVSLGSNVTIRRLGLLGFTLFYILTLATLVVGVELNGARRWISIAGQSIQPAEFLKPCFAVASAWLLAAHHRDDGFNGYLASILLYGSVLGVLILQPDLGMSVVISLIWMAQFFMAGVALSIVTGLIMLGVGGIIAAYLFLPHVTSRIDRFLDPSKGDTFQVDQSLAAFQNGGLLGTGPGQGEVKLRLPDAHADFIFAVAGEEFGLILTMMIVGLFAFILWRGLYRLRQQNDLFTLLAAGGLLAQFAVQSLVHMASSLQLIPAKGMTLPFLSYGGSSLVALGIGMGIVLGLTRQNKAY